MEAPWTEIVIVCQHCGSDNLPGRESEAVPSSTPNEGRPRLNVGGRTYVLEGRLGSGDACEVYRARWVRRLGELSVVKVLRHLGDADLVRREWAVVGRLMASRAQGSEHFRRLLPQPVALSVHHDGPHERLVTVWGWRSGFVHTVEDIHRVWGGEVPGPVLVWISKRVLELLTWVHASGVVHGAVLPGHILVHPRDHGAVLVGWSLATTRAAGERLAALPRRLAHVYPKAVRAGAPPEPATDLAMLAWSVLHLAGATGPAGRAMGYGTLAEPLGRVLVDAAEGRWSDAWALRDAVDAASRAAYGPPAYNPLPMPGWT